MPSSRSDSPAPLGTCTVGELADLLSSPNRHHTMLLFGAACSSALPSDIPSAVPWKRLVLRALNARAAAGLSDADIDVLASSPALPLEAIFQALEERRRHLGTDLVRVIDQQREPNPLHSLAARANLLGAVSAIVTTNFDCLLEEATARFGGTLSRWVVDQPWSSEAQLFKVHGSADRPATLRHTFRTINTPFSKEVHEGLAHVSGGRIVALGYEGRDFDVLAPMARGGEVLWLTYPDRQDSPAGALRLSRHRVVRLAHASLGDLVEAMGLEYPGDGGIGTAVSDASHLLLHRLNPEDALSILVNLSYGAMVGDRRCVSVDQHLVTALNALGTTEEVLLARAARAQFTGRALSPVGSAALFLRAAHFGQPGIRRSDAADAAALTLNGMIPYAHALFTLTHRRAASESAGVARALYLFRYGRSLASLGRHRKAIEVFSRALEDVEGDMYLEAILHRRRALSLARVREDAWRRDLERAHELLDFEGRSAELGDLMRSEAACIYLATGDRRRARRLADDARRSHERNGQRGGARRSAVLAGALRVPGLAKVALKLLYG